MHDAVVRRATLDDAPALAEFVLAEAREAENRAIEPSVVDAAVSATLGDPTLARYWMVCEGPHAVGAIAVVREWSDWNNAAYWWIQFVYLLPHARGRGLLSLLVDRVIGEARVGNAPELRLYVHPDNRRAIKAYERLGFRSSPYSIMTLPLSPSHSDASALDDDALWQAFQDRVLPRSGWTHAEHLRIAWMHRSRYCLEEAHLRLRAGIIRLNAAHGLVETSQRGYHETLTRTWLALVAEARERVPCADSATFLAACALEREAPLRYYTRERLFSLAARATFVAPDLAPLPRR
jgi:ribosomal protein S18 acetylase RimI-like enzyme